MPARLEIYVKSPGFSLGSLLSRIIGTGMSIIKGK
jgi:hypothetical protein